MMPDAEYSLSEKLAWAQWWACAWKSAHEDWKGDQPASIDALYQNRGSLPDGFMGVDDCLPPVPHPTVLRLALASSEQLELALKLVNDTLSPQAAAGLDDSHHQWCIRLSKALPPTVLAFYTDPLQLLHSWLEPNAWQRLRLRFPRERACRIEQIPACLERASSRLNTLWQAVVWRVTSQTEDSITPESHV